MVEYDAIIEHSSLTHQWRGAIISLMNTPMRNSPEAKKTQTVADLAAARAEVIGAIAALAPEDRDTVFLGAWSAHDIAAHLIGWDHANLEAVEAILAGRLPAFYQHYDTDWRSFNAGLVAQHKQSTAAETLAAAMTSHQALLDRLAALPAADLSRDTGVRSPRGRRVTVAMLLAAEAGDERRHAAQISEHGLVFTQEHLSA